MASTSQHDRLSTMVATHERAALPEPIVEALNALQAGDLRLEDLHSHLARSDALQHRLLRLANGAYFPFRGIVPDVRAAARRVGLRTTAGLTILDAIGAEFLGDGLTWYGHRPCGLLTHSLAVAQTAWAISELLDQPECARGIAYVAGLFHDVGKLTVVGHLGSQVTRCLREDLTDVPPESEALTRIERLAVGFSHDQASAEIAAHWGLSERVCQHIALTHDDDSTSIGAQILRVADGMVTAIGVGYFQDVGCAWRFGDRVLNFGAHLIDSDELLERCQRIALRESARAVMIVQATEPSPPT